MNFEQKLVLLAGCSSGYLKVWTALMAAQGARVFVALPRAEQVDGIDTAGTVIRCDLGNLADLDRMYEEV